VPASSRPDRRCFKVQCTRCGRSELRWGKYHPNVHACQHCGGKVIRHLLTPLGAVKGYGPRSRALN
jgi:rRNA maturation endonuclease Nob1